MLLNAIVQRNAYIVVAGASGKMPEQVRGLSKSWRKDGVAWTRSSRKGSWMYWRGRGGGRRSAGRKGRKEGSDVFDL